MIDLLSYLNLYRGLHHRRHSVSSRRGVSRRRVVVATRRAIIIIVVIVAVSIIVIIILVSRLETRETTLATRVDGAVLRSGCVRSVLINFELLLETVVVEFRVVPTIDVRLEHDHGLVEDLFEFVEVELRIGAVDSTLLIITVITASLIVTEFFEISSKKNGGTSNVEEVLDHFLALGRFGQAPGLLAELKEGFVDFDSTLLIVVDVSEAVVDLIGVVAEGVATREDTAHCGWGSERTTIVVVVVVVVVVGVVFIDLSRKGVFDAFSQ